MVKSYGNHWIRGIKMLISLQKNTYKTLLGVAVLTTTISFSNSQKTFAADRLSEERYKTQSEFNHSKNWYVSLFGGINFNDDVDFSNGQRTVATDFDTGFRLGAAIGKKWRNHKIGGLTPRTEIEVNYAESDVDSLDFSGNGAGNEVVLGDSKISSINVLASLYFDAENALGRGITPYIGGGIGFSHINHDIVYGGAALNLEDDDTVFTWHITGGVNYDINEKVSAFIDVGYHQALDAGSQRRIGLNPIAGVNGGRFEDDIDQVVVRSGLKFNF